MSDDLNMLNIHWTATGDREKDSAIESFLPKAARNLRFCLLLPYIYIAIDILRLLLDLLYNKIHLCI